MNQSTDSCFNNYVHNIEAWRQSETHAQTTERQTCVATGRICAMRADNNKIDRWRAGQAGDERQRPLLTGPEPVESSLTVLCIQWCTQRGPGGRVPQTRDAKILRTFSKLPRTCFCVELHCCSNIVINWLFQMITCRWLGSRVVSVLDSGAGGSGFKSQSRRCLVTVLGKLFTPIVPLFTRQHKLVAALLRFARITAGLAESNWAFRRV